MEGVIKEVSDFKLFQLEFKKWYERFGLSGWKLYFKEEALENCFTEVRHNCAEMVAIVVLNNKLPEKDIPFKDIKCSAKHEALHLLLGRFSYNANSRCVSSAELYESEEELINKLEELIKE